MAKFELSLVQRKRDAHNTLIELGLPFTSFHSSIQYFDIDQWFFYPDVDKEKKILFQNYTSDFNYSFNEHLSLHKNAQAELTFSMHKYLMIESIFSLNPFASSLKTGSIIKLKDQNEIVRYFWVKNISYKFTKINIEYNFTCQDCFSYMSTRKNNGYAIINDFSSEDFIGAKTTDYWAKKIVTECNLNYSYEDILSHNPYGKIKYINNIPQLTQEQEQYLNTFNRYTCFSVDNSNGYNALVTLGSQLGLIMEVDESQFNHFKFWFKPEKNILYNGLRYSPYDSINDFGLSQQGDSLVSVLNVFNTSADNISLLDDIPMEMLLSFSTRKWRNSIYYPGFYKDYCGPQGIGLWNYKILENEFETTEDGQIVHKRVPNIPKKLEQFLQVVDNVPWLENKIINFEYFYKNKLMSDKQYSSLWNSLTNLLRIANGELMYARNIYMNSYSKAMKLNVHLDEILINYCADFGCYVTSPLEHSDKIVISNQLKSLLKEDAKNLLRTSHEKIAAEFYTTIKQNGLLTSVKTEIPNRFRMISHYGTELVRSQQNLLKNMYSFFHYRFSDGDTWEDKSKNPQIGNPGETYDSLQTPDKLALETYWNQAHAESMICEYYIPQDWTKIFVNKDGILDLAFNSEFIMNISKTEPDLDVNNKLIYSEYEYVPREKTPTKIPSFPAIEILNSYIDYEDYNPQLAKGVWVGVDTIQSITSDNGEITGYEWQKGFPIKDDWYTCDSGGISWNDLMTKFSGFTTFPCENIPANGMCPMYLKILLTCFSDINDSIEDDFRKATQKHNSIWQDLYKEFNSFLLEGKYEDSSAGSSTELFYNAMTYFKDLSKPEYQYNLSIININNLKGYKGEPIHISDQIQLSADEFYEESDELKEVIRQPLFITDIDYDLRSDENIKLTVNAIKYQDKVIQRLVSLIK